ncbi:MAG: SPASM domain-containing protein [Cyanobacteriota bacterium]|nr:SPASM domain-containing protein [Cyanobacteriota bacterium]
MTSPTKACLDPWSFLMIKADGDVSLCCWSAPVGNTNSADLDEIITGLKAQHLRSSLLTGELLPCCRSCPARADTTTDALQEDVTTYLSDTEHRYTISQGVLVAKANASVHPNRANAPGSRQNRGGSRTNKLLTSLRSMLKPFTAD